MYCKNFSKLTFVAEKILLCLVFSDIKTRAWLTKADKTRAIGNDSWYYEIERKKLTNCLIVCSRIKKMAKFNYQARGRHLRKATRCNHLKISSQKPKTYISLFFLSKFSNNKIAI